MITGRVIEIGTINSTLPSGEGELCTGMVIAISTKGLREITENMLYKDVVISIVNEP
jgi:hypothetical protein